LLDERVVPFDHSDSNIKALKDFFIGAMINDGLIKKENIILPDFSLNNV
jgi:6-phosphogluconolactonase/glucosamine-6-phosphate isomerase/deaminase